jgi:antitoxin component of RelBE/YafQ-DinJ toxin-antitoxin module
VAETENLRVRIGPELKQRFDEMLEARGVTQQRALEAMVEWIVDEDALTQLQIFKQAPLKDRAELSRIVLKRLGAGKGKR